MTSVPAALAWLALSLAAPAAPGPTGPSGPPGATGSTGPSTSFLRENAETRSYRAGSPVRPTVLPGGAEALFLRSGPRSGVQSLFATDLATGATREVLTAEALLAAEPAELTDAERARLERQRITARGITHYKVSRDGALVLASVGGRTYLVDRARGSSRRLPLPAGSLDPRFSPDGKAVAFVAGGELHVLDLASGKALQLTTGATEWKTHGLAEFVAQEEMGRSEGYWWSPDSRWIAFEEADDGPVEKLSIQDPARPERQAVRFAYPRPGKENTAVRLGVVPASGGATTWISWDRARYPYLAQVRWEEGGPLLLLVQNRAQTEQAVLRADPATGETATLLVERDPAWVNLHDAMLRRVPGHDGFLWVTERNGGAELELRAADGSLAAPVAPREWGFVALAGVSKDGLVYFVGTRGDPTQEWLYRVRPGGVPEEVPLSVERPASLSATVADGGAALVVTSSRPESGTRTAVHAPDGKERARLPSVAAEPPWRALPEVRRVGSQGLWTSVVKPRDFQPGRKYPVIVEVYGGPTHFSPLRMRTAAPMTQWLADQGFIVVKIVNRGETARLGRDFERAVKGDLAGPALDDQVAGLRALAAEVPEMDLGRVGITGWSFGGYMAALAALRRPDVYKAAIAGAPVVDWRDYDTHYTERYLGLPATAPEAYARSALSVEPGKAHAPILLVHGTADDNVYFLHSLKLADTLFRAGAPATFVPLSNVTHLPADPSTAERLAELELAFFRQHLGTPEP
jgi:dipeptidyl-peptidase-4